MDIHMKIPQREHVSDDAFEHASEKATRWGAYLALAGVGALVIDAALGIAMIPLGATMMVAGAIASARRA
ncbi:MAG: hypothetical protein H0W83_11660 [Planctomycetes bacterium]|nr:hypothetical protein [Planctomycetota bacterium]